MKQTSHEKRIPKRGERVLAKGKLGLFAVLNVHPDFETADPKPIGRSGIVLRSIHWNALSFVSPGQFRPPLEEKSGPQYSLGRREKLIRFTVVRRSAGDPQTISQLQPRKRIRQRAPGRPRRLSAHSLRHRHLQAESETRLRSRARPE